jgi:thiaminase
MKNKENKMNQDTLFLMKTNKILLLRVVRMNKNKKMKMLKNVIREYVMQCNF